MDFFSTYFFNTLKANSIASSVSASKEAGFAALPCPLYNNVFVRL